MQIAANKAQEEYIAALANDLNTAEARAPIFDLVRLSNTAMDQGKFFRVGSRGGEARAGGF